MSRVTNSPFSSRWPEFFDWRLARLGFCRRRSCISYQDAPVIFDALSHPRRQCLLGVTQVVGHLQVHPEFRRRFEKRSQSDRRVSCDASFILQNRRDPVGRHPDRLRERVCRQAQRFQKLLVENFTRRNRSHSTRFHFANMVMIRVVSLARFSLYLIHDKRHATQAAYGYTRRGFDSEAKLSFCVFKG